MTDHAIAMSTSPTSQKLLKNIAEELGLSNCALVDMIVHHWVTDPAGYKALQAAVAEIKAVQEKYPEVASHLM